MKNNRTKVKISLDNTLRYLYSTFRKRRVCLVAIEFKHRGKLWRADTVKEALELRKALEEESEIADLGAEPISEQDEDWTPDVLSELLQGLGDLQKSFLRILYEHWDFVESEKIVKGLSLDSEVSFAGVLSGLSKQSRKLNIMPSKIYQVQVDWQGKSKTRSFRLSSGFRRAADELGWPENWI